jgi:hypothetical protein
MRGFQQTVLCSLSADFRYWGLFVSGRSKTAGLGSASGLCAVNCIARPAPESVNHGQIIIPPFPKHNVIFSDFFQADS